MTGLKKRLETCRERVEKEEVRELEESRRHNRTVGLAWGIAGFALVILVLVVWWNKSVGGIPGEIRKPGNGQKGEEREVLRARLEEKGVGWVLEDFGRRGTGVGKGDVGSEERTGGLRGRETDEVLDRIFDEL